MANVWRLILIFFFFQAEDGIRDADVTGVQTCALPISRIEIADLGNADLCRTVQYKRWITGVPCWRMCAGKTCGLTVGEVRLHCSRSFVHNKQASKVTGEGIAGI